MRMSPVLPLIGGGLTKLQPVYVGDVATAVAGGIRTGITLTQVKVRPKVTRANFGPVIVIRRKSNRLFLYNGMRYRRLFAVATGQHQYPTPLGRFAIVVKWKNPWWYPPDSPWANCAIAWTCPRQPSARTSTCCVLPPSWAMSAKAASSARAPTFRAWMRCSPT